MKKILGVLVALNVFSSIGFFSGNAVSQSCTGLFAGGSESCGDAKGDECGSKYGGKLCKGRDEGFENMNDKDLRALEKGIDDARKDLGALKFELETHREKDYHGEVLKKGGWVKKTLGYMFASALFTTIRNFFKIGELFGMPLQRLRYYMDYLGL